MAGESEQEVRFEFWDPEERDVRVLEPMLRYLVDSMSFDAGSLAEAVASQPRVGIIVKANGGDDPVAILTVLPLQLHSSSGWLQQLSDLLHRHCRNRALSQKYASHELIHNRFGLQVKSVLNSTTCGLLVSERPRNTPDALAPHLLRGVLDEVQWATEDEPNKALRSAYKLNQLLVVTWCYASCADTNDNDGGRSGARPKKRRRAESTSSLSVNFPVHAEYAKAEDRELHKRCDWSFVFPAHGKRFLGDAHGLEPMRLAYCVQLSKAREAQRALEREFGTAGDDDDEGADAREEGGIEKSDDGDEDDDKKEDEAEGSE